MVRYKGKCHVSSTNPDRQADEYLFAEKEIDLIQDGAQTQSSQDTRRERLSATHML